MEEVEDIGYFDEEHKFYKTEQSNVINQIPFHKINNLNINSISSSIPNINSISKITTSIPKKKISYDDLLSSMGMKIINGKLELYNKNLIGKPLLPSHPIPKNVEDYRYQQNRKNQNNQSYPMTENRGNQNNHPMTEQQYRKHVQLQYLKNQYERQRINQIKSKKILFTNPNTSVNIQNSNNLNKMFHFVR